MERLLRQYCYTHQNFVIVNDIASRNPKRLRVIEAIPSWDLYKVFSMESSNWYITPPRVQHVPKVHATVLYYLYAIQTVHIFHVGSWLFIWIWKGILSFIVCFLWGEGSLLLDRSLIQALDEDDDVSARASATFRKIGASFDRLSYSTIHAISLHVLIPQQVLDQPISSTAIYIILDSLSTWMIMSHCQDWYDF